MTSSTASRYSARPADSSSHGRSTAKASWPAPRSSSATSPQSDPRPPAPWIRTKVAISGADERAGRFSSAEELEAGLRPEDGGGRLAVGLALAGLHHLAHEEAGE